MLFLKVAPFVADDIILVCIRPRAMTSHCSCSSPSNSGIDSKSVSKCCRHEIGLRIFWICYYLLLNESMGIRHFSSEFSSYSVCYMSNHMAQERQATALLDL